MTKDPVCGETVEVARHTHKKLHQGVIYHFCSEDCRDKFAQDPEEYAKNQPRAGAYT